MGIDVIDYGLSYSSSDYEPLLDRGYPWEGKSVRHITSRNQVNMLAPFSCSPTYTPPPPDWRNLSSRPFTTTLPPPTITPTNMPSFRPTSYPSLATITPPNPLQLPTYRPTFGPSSPLMTYTPPTSIPAMQSTPISLHSSITNPPTVTSFIPKLPRFDSPASFPTPQTIQLTQIPQNTSQIPHSPTTNFASTAPVPSSFNATGFLDHDISKHVLTTQLPPMHTPTVHYLNPIINNPPSLTSASTISTPSITTINHASINTSSFNEGLTHSFHNTLQIESVGLKAIDPMAPTALQIKPQEPPSLSGRVVSTLKDIGSFGVYLVSDVSHELWKVLCIPSPVVSLMKDFIDNRIINSSSNLEKQSPDQLKAGHIKIDEFFGTNLAYKYDPNFHSLTENAMLVIPYFSPGGAALAGRVGQIVSLDANTFRTGKIASEVIKEITSLERAGLATQEATSSIVQLEKQISGWLGDGAKFIRNESGDSVFISKDGMRRVRFDFNRPYPHNNPHAHIEYKVGVNWEGSEQIYPIDVPHN